MARKRLQYQSLSQTFLPIVAVITTPSALAFSSFSQPLVKTIFPAVQQQSVIFEVGFLGPAQTPSSLVFSKFEPPKFSTVFPAYQQQTTFFVVPPAPAPTPTSLVFSQFIPQFNRGVSASQQPQPTARVTATASYDTGLSFFSQFIPVLRPPLPVSVSFANFAHITPPDFPPIQEKNDGIFVKKKRKPTKRELDPYREEAELKEKRREAIVDALYGPVVEYTLPPFILPSGPPAPPNLGDLPQIILAAQQAEKMQKAHKAEMENAEDEEIIGLLGDIL